MFDRENPSLGDYVFGMLMLYFWVSSFVWGWQNPTANAVTVFRYFPHAMAWEKMEQFQVSDSR